MKIIYFIIFNIKSKYIFFFFNAQIQQKRTIYNNINYSIILVIMSHVIILTKKKN